MEGVRKDWSGRKSVLMISLFKPIATPGAQHTSLLAFTPPHAQDSPAHHEAPNKSCLASSSSSKDSSPSRRISASRNRLLGRVTHRAKHVPSRRFIKHHSFITISLRSANHSPDKLHGMPAPPLRFLLPDPTGVAQKAPAERRRRCPVAAQ